MIMNHSKLLIFDVGINVLKYSISNM